MTSDPRAQAIADVLAAIRAAAQADHRDGYNIKPRTIDPATGAALAWDRAIRAAEGARVSSVECDGIGLPAPRAQRLATFESPARAPLVRPADRDAARLSRVLVWCAVALGVAFIATVAGSHVLDRTAETVRQAQERGAW